MEEKPPPYTVLDCRDRPPPYFPSDPPPEFHISADPASYLQVTAHQSDSQNACPGDQQTITSRADNFMLTVLMMMLCAFLLNLVAFFFLIPALIYSRKAAQVNDFTLARQFSQMSLYLNIAAVISFIVLIVVGVMLGTIISFT